MQWDAVLHLRVLNKYYFRALEAIIDQLTCFIKAQVDSLRSNNSRNALALFHEIFSQNAELCPEGLKINDTWSVFLDATFPVVFSKCAADKKFLQLLA